MNAQNPTDKFAHALKAFLTGAGEESLLAAYEIGRNALAAGTSVLDITAEYKNVLISILEDDRSRDPVDLIRAAEPFLFECLSPYHLSQQSALEANSLLRRLNQMLEEEAGRIAHALHDEAGGILASARMKLDLAARVPPEDLLERLEQVRQLLDQTGEQLRHLSHELRPIILDDLGPVPALDYLAQGLAKRTGLEIVIDGHLDRRTEPAVELALYRAVQEALNNVARHARNATRATVRISRQRSQIHCTIEDDGSGFDPETVLADSGHTTMGLAGIRERVHAVGGSLDIDSSAAGTVISVRVPDRS